MKKKLAESSQCTVVNISFVLSKNCTKLLQPALYGTIFFSLFTKFIYLNDFLFYVLIPWYVKYSSSIFKNK